MSRIICAIAIMALLFAFPACKKEDTSFERRLSMKTCQVTQIVHSPSAGGKETLAFGYNSSGDPLSITRLPKATTGSPNYIFKYDNNRRLSELVGTYAPNGSATEFYHKYFYTNAGSNEISIDSSYTFPNFAANGSVSWYFSASATHFTYDKTGRIIKDSTIINPGQITRVNNYTYDIDGNIAGRRYDNGLNLRRTHKIWMFLGRDYSMNNPFYAEAYNPEGFPEKINFSNESGEHLNFIALMRDATISYDCK